MVPESAPDEKHQFAKEIEPLIAVPDWEKLAVRVPLAPREALHVPCQAPAKLVTSREGVTLKDTAFEVPPPGGGLVTNTE
jgi:hypothetical protein